MKLYQVWNHPFLAMIPGQLSPKVLLRVPGPFIDQIDLIDIMFKIF